MIEERKTIALPPEQVTALVQTALRARQNGDQRAARTLLQALATRQPNVAQIWLALATVAETRDEQRAALERAITLEPQNQFAQRALARFAAGESHGSAGAPWAPSPAAQPIGAGDSVTVEPAAEADLAARAATSSTLMTGAAAPNALSAADPATVETSAPAPSARATMAIEALAPAPALTPAEPASPARDIRWPAYAIVGVAILVVLIAAVLIRPSDAPSTADRPVETPALPGAASTIAQSAATAAPMTGGAATQPALDVTSVAPGAGAGQAAATATPVRSTPRPTTAPPTTTPQPTRPALAPGQVVTYGQWHAVLIRPDDARSLDGAIGSLQPRGRFVLALLALGNDGTAPARPPADLFTLVDAQGRRYQPLPAASTEYLNSYSRGEHGDLSMEETIPADGSNKSVPIIFDVPATARGLYLLIGDGNSGWAIGE